MNQQIALLRGINVGGRNILKMAELRSLLETIGLRNVRSYIQSGNIIFDSRATDLEDTIKNKIAEVHKIDVTVLILSSKELKNIRDNSPYLNKDIKSQHFFFLKSPPKDADLSKLKSIKTHNEKFHLNDHVLYLHAPSGIGRSKLVAKLESILGVSVTARNRNTVNKVIDLCTSNA